MQRCWRFKEISIKNFKIVVLPLCNFVGKGRSWAADIKTKQSSKYSWTSFLRERNILPICCKLLQSFIIKEFWNIKEGRNDFEITFSKVRLLKFRKQ